MHARGHTHTEGESMTEKDKQLEAKNKKLREALERIKAMTNNGTIWEIARKALEETK